MRPGWLVVGVCLLLSVYWEAFETIIFPRRVTRRFRFTRIFYRATWMPWRALGEKLSPGRPREAFLSVYGPISLLFLLFIWATLIVLAFALLYWGAGSHLHAPAEMHGFVADLFLSSAALFTLTLGDISPASGLERLLMVAEAGTGLGFLAMVIGYLPVLSQAFSRREVSVTLLDPRAGSPPSASELLMRHSGVESAQALAELLAQWDRWSADLLETHISFPVLGYYRSQHDNQSWVAALTAILDACALFIAALENVPVRPARLTFAMARHAAVDLSRAYRLAPRAPEPDRLSAHELAQLRSTLAAAGLSVRAGPDADERLGRLRRMYEPYMNALGRFLLMPLPPWSSPAGVRDNWESTR
jgi:hypothetical protein